MTSQRNQATHSLFGSIGRGLSKVGRRVARAFVSLYRFGTQRYTVMFIPHSEKRGLNFQINSFAMLFIAAVLAVLIGGFFYLSTYFSGSARLIRDRTDALEQSEASLDGVIEELSELLNVYQVFDSTLQQTLRGLDIAAGDTPQEVRAGGGDLSAFLNVRSVEAGEIRELQEIQRVADTLKNAIDPLTEIAAVIDAQKEILGDIPNLWPVIDGRGRVTMEFGPNRHPINDQWYIHKGFDIADAVGVPIVAAANGKVTEVGVDPTGYGLYVWVDHKYGFKTRYSHLQRIYVSEGQDVHQGESMGTLGNTGLSTGPHLDFQIWLGTDVVDPAAFLKISTPDFKRWTGNRYVDRYY